MRIYDVRMLGGGIVVGAILAGFAAPLHAQAAYGPVNDKPEAAKSIAERADAALAREKALLEDPNKRCRREAENSREIVVCADPDKNTRDRLPLRNETDTAKSTRTGVPRAPDLDGIKCTPAPMACAGAISAVRRRRSTTSISARSPKPRRDRMPTRSPRVRSRRPNRPGCASPAAVRSGWVSRRAGAALRRSRIRGLRA